MRILPTDMDLVPGAACTSVLLLFPSSLSMSEAVVDIGVADFEPVRSDSSSCDRKVRIYAKAAEIRAINIAPSCVLFFLNEELMTHKSQILPTPAQRKRKERKRASL